MSRTVGASVDLSGTTKPMADTEMSDVVGAEAPVSYLNVVGGYICTGRLSEFSYESIETFNVAVDFEAGYMMNERRQKSGEKTKSK